MCEVNKCKEMERQGSKGKEKGREINREVKETKRKINGRKWKGIIGKGRKVRNRKRK